jgi:hypothetical protein
MPRYEHENWGSVQNHTFMKGTITSVNSSDDTADVTVEGAQNGTDTPIFYHCDPDSEERNNGAIEGAAGGFSVDDEVIVMVTVDGEPVRILGLVDGIRECTAYLLLKATSFGSGDWYSLWNAAREEAVEELTFTSDEEDITLTFPMEAKIDRDLYGDVVSDDPLYKWLKTRRPGDETPEFADLPEVPAADSVVFSVISKLGGGYEVPETPAFDCITASCYVNNSADSCSQSFDVSVPSRKEWGTVYGLENEKSWSVASACTLLTQPHRSTYSHTGVYGVNYSALYEANYLTPGSSDSLLVSGPFNSYAVSMPETPDDYISDKSIRQEFSHTDEAEHIQNCDQAEPIYLPGWPGVPPIAPVTGINTLNTYEDYQFSFDTLLGPLDPISFSAVWEQSRQPTSSWPIAAGCGWHDPTYVVTGRKPRWLGLPGLKNQKNTAIFKQTDKIMFQVYYYSTGITSETYRHKPGYTIIAPESFYSVSTGNMTSIKASVVYAPGLIEDMDPLNPEPPEGVGNIMEVHEDFQKAIWALFNTTMGASTAPDDNGIRHFDITVYN